jgi:hypothetical protein
MEGKMIRTLIVISMFFLSCVTQTGLWFADDTQAAGKYRTAEYYITHLTGKTAELEIGDDAPIVKHFRDDPKSMLQVYMLWVDVKHNLYAVGFAWTDDDPNRICEIIWPEGDVLIVLTEDWGTQEVIGRLDVDCDGLDNTLREQLGE